MKQVGDRVEHVWGIGRRTVRGTVREQTEKEGELAWRIEFDEPQQHPGSTEPPASEIIVKQSDIAAWLTV